MQNHSIAPVHCDRLLRTNHPLLPFSFSSTPLQLNEPPSATSIPRPILPTNSRSLFPMLGPPKEQENHPSTVSDNTRSLEVQRHDPPSSNHSAPSTRGPSYRGSSSNRKSPQNGPQKSSTQLQSQSQPRPRPRPQQPSAPGKQSSSRPRSPILQMASHIVPSQNPHGSRPTTPHAALRKPPSSDSSPVASINRMHVSTFGGWDSGPRQVNKRSQETALHPISPPYMYESQAKSTYLYQQSSESIKRSSVFEGPSVEVNPVKKTKRSKSSTSSSSLQPPPKHIQEDQSRSPSLSILSVSSSSSRGEITRLSESPTDSALSLDLSKLPEMSRAKLHLNNSKRRWNVTAANYATSVDPRGEIPGEYPL